MIAPPRYDGGMLPALRIEKHRRLRRRQSAAAAMSAPWSIYLGIGRRRRDAPRAAPGLILPDSIDLAAFESDERASSGVRRAS